MPICIPLVSYWNFKMFGCREENQLNKKVTITLFFVLMRKSSTILLYESFSVDLLETTFLYFRLSRGLAGLVLVSRFVFDHFYLCSMRFRWSTLSTGGWSCFFLCWNLEVVWCWWYFFYFFLGICRPGPKEIIGCSWSLFVRGYLSGWRGRELWSPSFST